MNIRILRTVILVACAAAFVATLIWSPWIITIRSSGSELPRTESLFAAGIPGPWSSRLNYPLLLTWWAVIAVPTVIALRLPRKPLIPPQLPTPGSESKG